MNLLPALIILLIFMLLSLVIPIVIVIKWRSRPGWALFTASGLYCLPIIPFSLGPILSGYQDATGSDLWISFFVFLMFWLVPGFLILLIIQWQSRKRRKRKERAVIEEAF
jgi:amino acid transporter